MTVIFSLISLDFQSVRASEQWSAHPLAKSVFPKIVKIYGSGGLRNLANYGTAIVISPEGHLLTAWNHLLDARELLAVTHDGRRYTAQFIGGAGEVGLAVLKLNSVEPFDYFPLNNNSTYSPGTPIFAFSNMFNVANGNEPVSVIHGVVSAIAPLDARRGGFTIPYENDVIIIDGIVNNSGAAGGAVTNSRGELIGIIGKELKDRRSNLWINYAIPMADISETIQKMIAGETIREQSEFLPQLVKPIDLSPLGIKLVPNVVARTPAYIDTIQPGSQADRVGLIPDDLIVLINDELVQSCEEFYRIFGDLRAGDEIQVTVRRNQELKIVSLEIPLP